MGACPYRGDFNARVVELWHIFLFGLFFNYWLTKGFCELESWKYMIAFYIVIFWGPNIWIYRFRQSWIVANFMTEHCRHNVWHFFSVLCRLPQITAHSGRNAAEMPQKCRRNAAEMPQKCRRNAAEMPLHAVLFSLVQPYSRGHGLNWF